MNFGKRANYRQFNKNKIFLFPSKIDSFWIVKLESLSIWVPVICFDNFWEEIIVNWKNWFCVKSEQDFINKTQELLIDDNLYNKLQSNTLSTINIYNKFNFEKQLNDIFCF